MSDNYALDTLRTFVRLPSLASDGAGMLAAADYAEEQLRALGFTVWRHGPAERPVIFAELAGADPRYLLFYNHYDVTDPGPHDAWKYPPFSAQVAQGQLYGRGSSDHKASFVARLAAIRQLLQQGPLPVGVRFLLDSEEELGSPALEGILSEYGHELAAAGGLYSGGALDENDRPVIRAGSKGMCSLELTIVTAPQQLHSKWAAILPNPAWRLIAALNSLYNPHTETVLFEGFHDGIKDTDADDLRALAQLDFGVDAFMDEFRPVRIKAPVDQTDILRRLMFEPTFNLAHFSAGDGGRTVLPGKAVAILDMRLVPGQQSSRIARLIYDHLQQHGFNDVQLRHLGGSEADRCALSDPTVVALERAAEQVYGVAAQVHPSGAGSGPRWLFRKHLGISLVQDPGASWSGSNDHAPNENVRLDDFLANVQLVERFIREYATLN